MEGEGSSGDGTRKRLRDEEASRNKEQREGILADAVAWAMGLNDQRQAAVAQLLAVQQQNNALVVENAALKEGLSAVNLQLAAVNVQLAEAIVDRKAMTEARLTVARLEEKVAVGEATRKQEWEAAEAARKAKDEECAHLNQQLSYLRENAFLPEDVPELFDDFDH